MVHLLPWEMRARRESSEFSRWEKRSVISNHFSELALEITEMGMPTSHPVVLLLKLKRVKIQKKSKTRN